MPASGTNAGHLYKRAAWHRYACVSLFVKSTSILPPSVYKVFHGVVRARLRAQLPHSQRRPSHSALRQAIGCGVVQASGFASSGSMSTCGTGSSTNPCSVRSTPTLTVRCSHRSWTMACCWATSPTPRLPMPSSFQTGSGTRCRAALKRAARSSESTWARSSASALCSGYAAAGAHS